MKIKKYSEKVNFPTKSLISHVRFFTFKRHSLKSYLLPQFRFDCREALTDCKKNVISNLFFGAEF